MGTVSRLSRAGRSAMLAAVLALVAVVVAIPAAHHAHAAPNYINAWGGPEQIYVTGGGFTGSATVRLVVIDASSGKGVGSPRNVLTNPMGFIDGVYLTGLGHFFGNVYVLADQAGLPTVGATATVQSNPQFSINGTYQTSCGYPVNATVTGLMHYYNVRIGIHNAADLSLLAPTYPTQADGVGDAYVPGGFTVPPPPPGGEQVWLVSDETTGPPGSPPFYVTVGYYLRIC